MNFLAHLALSDGSDESLAGHILGDFAKKEAELVLLTPAMRRGVWLHRKADSFTDAHMVTAKSRARVSQPYRRFAGVLVDMFYDHILAALWNDFYSISLEEFARNAYRALRRFHDILPARFRELLPWMERYNWLCLYRDKNALVEILDRMGMRLSRPTPLGGAVKDLTTGYADFTLDFQSFYPDLQAHMRELETAHPVREWEY